MQTIGTIGGILFLVDLLFSFFMAVRKHYIEIGKRQRRLEELDEDDGVRPTIGFKTRKEQLEEELLISEAKIKKIDKALGRK